MKLTKKHQLNLILNFGSNLEALYVAYILEAMKKAIYTRECLLLRNWLTEKRHISGLSQRQLSSLLNVHHSIIGKIETGERQINVVELIQYCQVLNCDPIEIIKQLNLNSLTKHPV